MVALFEVGKLGGILAHAYKGAYLKCSLLTSQTFVHVQLRQEKVQLEHTLEQEQVQQIAKLQRKIDRLEKETHGKQDSLDKVNGCRGMRSLNPHRYSVEVFYI